MVLPASGPLSLVSNIALEQRRLTTTGNVVTLADCAISANLGAAPYSLSEFYSYAHLTQSPVNLGTAQQTIVGIASGGTSNVLYGSNSCTVQVLGSFSNTTSGVIYEHGNSTTGLAIYMKSGGILYAAAGLGTSANVSTIVSNTLVSTSDIREIIYTAQTMPFIQSHLYVNGTLVSSNIPGGQYSTGISANSNSGSGNVYGTMRTTVGPTTTGLANATISAVNIWNAAARLPAIAKPTSNIMDRLTYTQNNYFDHSAQISNAVEIWVSPTGKQVSIVRGNGPTGTYNLANIWGANSATFDVSTTDNLPNPTSVSVRYTDGKRIYYGNSNATTLNVLSYSLSTAYDVTSTHTFVSSNLLYGNMISGTKPQGIDTFIDSSGNERIFIINESGNCQIRSATTLATVIESNVINSTRFATMGAGNSFSCSRFFYNGYKLVIGSNTNYLIEFDMTTPYTLSTLSYSGKFKLLSTVIGAGAGGLNGGSLNLSGLHGNEDYPETSGLWVCGTAAPNRFFKLNVSL